MGAVLCCCCLRRDFASLAEVRGKELKARLAALEDENAKADARATCAAAWASRTLLAAWATLGVVVLALVAAAAWAPGTAAVREVAAHELGWLAAAVVVSVVSMPWAGHRLSKGLEAGAVSRLERVTLETERALSQAVAELPAERAKALVERHANSAAQKQRVLGPLAAVSRLEDEVKTLRVKEAFLLRLVDAVAARACQLPGSDAARLLGPGTSPFESFKQLAREKRCPSVGRLVGGLAMMTPARPEGRAAAALAGSAPAHRATPMRGRGETPRAPKTAAAAAAPARTPAASTPLSIIGSLFWSPAPSTPATVTRRRPQAIPATDDAIPEEEDDAGTPIPRANLPGPGTPQAGDDEAEARSDSAKAKDD